jgi:hypothetical protein
MRDTAHLKEAPMTETSPVVTALPDEPRRPLLGDLCHVWDRAGTRCLGARVTAVIDDLRVRAAIDGEGPPSPKALQFSTVLDKAHSSGIAPGSDRREIIRGTWHWPSLCGR